MIPFVHDVPCSARRYRIVDTLKQLENNQGTNVFWVSPVIGRLL